MIKLTFPLKGRAVPVNVPESPSDLDAFHDWFAEANRRGPIGFDTETTGLNIFQRGYRLRTMQFGTRDEAWVLRVDNDPRTLHHGERVLQQANKLVIHNAAFDWLVCDTHTSLTMEFLAGKTTDSMLKAKVLDPRSRKEGGIGAKLKELSALFIDEHAPDTQDGLVQIFHRYGKTKDTGWDIPELIDDPTYLSYAGGDVILVSELDPILDEKLSELGVRPDLIEYEHELALICAAMTRAGCLVDEEYTIGLDDRLAQDFEKWNGIAADFGIKSVNSGPQVAEALIKSGVVLTERTESGDEWSTGKTVLNPLAGYSVKGERLDHITPHPIAEAVYHAKRAGKWRTTYVERFLNNRDDLGFIHPSINTLQARTARMSITGDLAAQTLPSGDWMIRRAIVGAEGESWFSVDFKAVEMRVLASLADVKRMKQAISEDRDLHDFTAELVYGAGFTKTQRKICKGIGFGKVYGGGLDTLVEQSGAPRGEVKTALARYEAVYPEIGRAGRRWQREARRNGFVTVTATGRPLPIDPDRAYTVTNYKCQSTARDVLGQGLIMIKEAGLLPYIKLPIHDEVTGSAPKGEAEEIVREIVKCMTMSLGGVPIDAEGEIGLRSWGSLYGASV